jgi:hypothetical protein
MGKPFSRFKSADANAASDHFISSCTGKHSDNSFLNAYVDELTRKNETLVQGIAKSKQKDLTGDAKEADTSFDENWVDFRNLVEIKADIAALGVEATACQGLASFIGRLDRDLQSLPRHAQISTMDNLLAESLSEEIQQQITQGKVRQLFTAVVDNHGILKAVEDERSSLVVEEGAIPAPWKTTKEITPILEIIYSHIEDFARLDSSYKPTQEALDAKLAPIVTQVRARDSRSDSQIESN